MGKVTIIIMLASIGFILMGIFILYNKTIKSIMVTNENYNKSNKFIKQNAYMNILAGLIGVIIAFITIIKGEWTKILILLFIIMIAILSLLQYILGKKYRN